MYNYEEQKAFIFTEAGQEQFLSIRDNVARLLEEAGAVTMGRATAGQTGDGWAMMACVDRLVELKEIREIPQKECVGQHRIFMSNRR